MFHEVSWISLESIKLIVGRTRDQAVLTADNIRVDVVTELYTHVGRTEEDLLTASRSLGEKTFDPEKVRNLLEAKVVSAIRSYAATKTLKELHENRDAFAKQIKSDVEELLIRLRSRSADPNKIGEIILRGEDDGSFLRIRDVAEVKKKFAETSNMSWVNGKRAVSIQVQKLPEEDLEEITEFAREYMEDFNARNQGVQLIM